MLVNSRGGASCEGRIKNRSGLSSLIIFTPLNGHLIGNGTGGNITATVVVLIFPSHHGAGWDALNVNER